MEETLNSYNNLRGAEFSRWMFLQKTFPSDFVQMRNREIDDKFEKVISYLKEKHFVTEKSDAGSSITDSDIDKLQLERYEEGIEQIKKTVSIFYQQFFPFSVKQILEHISTLNGDEVWKLKHIIGCCYDLFIFNENMKRQQSKDSSYLTKGLIAKITANQLEFYNGHLKFQDYYLFSPGITYLDASNLFDTKKEFILLKDQKADEKNNKKNFKFLQESDLRDIIKVCEFVSHNPGTQLLAVNISADNFKIEDGLIQYHDYILKSVRIKKIQNEVLEKIPHTFTLKRDFDKKDRRTKKFIFVPPTDLSLLLAEAERIKQDRNGNSKVTTTIASYPETGSFDLPWKNVIFFDGVMYLTHPNPSIRSTTSPFYYIHQSLKKSFRDIKPYIESRCAKFKVSSKDSIITEVHNFEDFKAQIPQLLDYFTRHESEVEIHNRSGYSTKPISSEVFKQLKWVKKSPYLNFLSQRQVPEYKIYYILESRIHKANNGEYDEYGYLFTVKSNSQFSILIYENTADESRSSIVFYVKSNSVLVAIEHIRRFFGSDIENKRQMLANKMIRFPSQIFNSYYRINHTDFFDWKIKLLEFLR